MTSTWRRVLKEMLTAPGEPVEYLLLVVPALVKVGLQLLVWRSALARRSRTPFQVIASGATGFGHDGLTAVSSR